MPERQPFRSARFWFRPVSLVSERWGEKKWIVGGIQMLSTPNRTIPGVWIQGSCKPEPSENRLANLSPLGYRSSTPALLKGDPKRLRTGRLSCRISTTAGSDMKSLSWSTIELHRWRDPHRLHWGSLSSIRGRYRLWVLRARYRAPQVQFAARSPSWRPSRCGAVVVPAFISPEIGTKMPLTASTAPATPKSLGKAISCHLSPHRYLRPAHRPLMSTDTRKTAAQPSRNTQSRILIRVDPCKGWRTGYHEAAVPGNDHGETSLYGGHYHSRKASERTNRMIAPNAGTIPKRHRSSNSRKKNTAPLTPGCGWLYSPLVRDP